MDKKEIDEIREKYKQYLGWQALKPDKTELTLSGMVKSLLAHIEEQDRRLNQNKCNSGHTTLPVYLWQCPVCVEKMEERYQSEITRLRDKLKDVVEVGRGYQYDINEPCRHCEEKDEIAQSALDKGENDGR